MKASSFIAAWLHCTKPAWEWATAFILLASLCTMLSHVQCKNETREGKRNPEIKARRGKIRKINGAERCWKAKWQGCAVPPGSVTWQTAQDLYYFITSRSHVRAGSSVLGCLVLHTAWPCLSKAFFSPLRVSSCYFCWCSSISDRRENMLAHGV